MDTVTYASVAAIYWTIAQERDHIVIPEKEFVSFKSLSKRRVVQKGCKIGSK
jgi:hypothetical protein